MTIEKNKENENLLDLKGLTKGKILSIYHLLCDEEENNPRMSSVQKDVLQFLRVNKEKFL